LKELINFRVPASLIGDFDAIARAKGLSRTALLNMLITDFCRAEEVKARDVSRAETERGSDSFDEVFEPVELDAVFDYDPFNDLRL
jgi:hypothetical protein